MVTCTCLAYQILVLLFQENQRMNKEISEVKAQLSVKSGDLLRLEELLDRVQEDKKRLSNRCNKMMSNGIYWVYIALYSSMPWVHGKILLTRHRVFDEYWEHRDIDRGSHCTCRSNYTVAVQCIQISILTDTVTQFCVGSS